MGTGSEEVSFDHLIINLHEVNRSMVFLKFNFSFRSAEITHELEGFYRVKYSRSTGRHSVCLALLADPDSVKSIPDVRSWRMKNVDFQTHRPHLGTQMRLEKFEEVAKKGDKITPAQAQKLWEYHQDSSVRQCNHMFLDGYCKDKIAGLDCDVSVNG